MGCRADRFCSSDHGGGRLGDGECGSFTAAPPAVLLLLMLLFIFQLHYLRLPKDISEDYVVLMDSTVSTGAAALMAVRVLLVRTVGGWAGTLTGSAIFPLVTFQFWLG